MTSLCVYLLFTKYRPFRLIPISLNVLSCYCISIPILQYVLPVLGHVLVLAFALDLDPHQANESTQSYTSVRSLIFNWYRMSYFHWKFTP